MIKPNKRETIEDMIAEAWKVYDEEKTEAWGRFRVKLKKINNLDDEGAKNE